MYRNGRTLKGQGFSDGFIKRQEYKGIRRNTYGNV
jgi:hypothetical protein